MIDLLPCPFCGGEPTLNVIHECEDGAGEVEFAYVYCSHCGTQRGERPSEFTARQAWNLRAPAQRCSRCGSSGDTYVLCSGCGSPLSSTERQPALISITDDDRTVFKDTPLSSTNLGSPATGTPSREPTGKYTITPAERGGAT